MFRMYYLPLGKETLTHSTVGTIHSLFSTVSLFFRLLLRYFQSYLLGLPWPMHSVYIWNQWQLHCLHRQCFLNCWSMRLQCQCLPERQLLSVVWCALWWLHWSRQFSLCSLRYQQVLGRGHHNLRLIVRCELLLRYFDLQSLRPTLQWMHRSWQFSMLCLCLWKVLRRRNKHLCHSLHWSRS